MAKITSHIINTCYRTNLSLVLYNKRSRKTAMFITFAASQLIKIGLKHDILPKTSWALIGQA